MRTYKEVRQALMNCERFHQNSPDSQVPFIREFPFAHPGYDLTEEDIASDTSFLDAWTQPLEAQKASAATLKALFPKVNPVLQYIAKEATFADPLKGGREWTVAMEPGLYNRQELLAGVRSFIKGKKKPRLSRFDFAPYRWTEPLVYLHYVKTGQRNGSNLHLMSGLDGTPTPVLDYENETVSQWRTLPGLMLDRWHGKPGPAITSEQYLKMLPALRLGMARFGFIYTTCVWDESLAAEWDKAPAVLESFKDMLKLLPQVDCYAAIPCRLRYVGFGRESQGGVLRKIEEPYSGPDNTLLYDGPAWILLLTINGKPIPGRVAVTEEGRFIVSEWCFRETPKQNERYEMFSGAFVKHTLLTWCAGPLLDRFGGSLSEFANAGAVDGRVPDRNNNPYRMKQFVGVNKMREVSEKIIRDMLKDLNPLSNAEWEAMHKKGIEYPIGLYDRNDGYVMLANEPIAGGTYFQGFKVSHLHVLSRGTTYKYDAYNEFRLHLYGQVILLPTSLVAAFFGIEVPNRAAVVPEPPPVVAQAPLEIPVLIEEPIEPVVPPPVLPVEPEPVPSLPAEAA